MKYIAFIEAEQYLHEKRSVAPSAASVALYMARKFEKFGRVDIISPTRTLHSAGKYPKRTTALTEHIFLMHPATRGHKSKLGKMAAVLYVRLWLLMYLLRHTKKDEQIVVYHSAAFMGIVSFAKRIKRFTLTSEVREIYADVTGNAAAKAKELKHLSKANNYIFATELLNEIVNKERKPYVIATGVYQSNPPAGCKLFDDGRIHVVYAGTLNPQKGGAKMAVEAAAYLSERYHMHILGYGDEETVAAVKNDIAAVASRTQASVTYDGCLAGDDLHAFLQSCDIGVSTQDISNPLNASSFPSKVFTYLANGLNVVSGYIPAVYTSGVGEHLTYYKDNSPEAIAEAIGSVSREADVKSLLEGLDQGLEAELSECFNKGVQVV